MSCGPVTARKTSCATSPDGSVVHRRKLTIDATKGKTAEYPDRRTRPPRSPAATEGSSPAQARVRRHRQYASRDPDRLLLERARARDLHSHHLPQGEGAHPTTTGRRLHR